MDDQTTFDSPDETGLQGGEPVPVDADGDGQADMLIGDANSDGVTDYVTITASDGSVVTAFDNDQSGTFEEVRIDTDGDWVADATAYDTTGDGQFDVLQQVDPVTGQIVTTSLDGASFDPTQVSLDPSNQDPTPSAPGTPGWYSEQGLPQPGQDQTPAPIPWDTAPGPVPAPADQPVVDQVHGDGATEASYGQDQAAPGYCGPASIAIILTEMLGRPIDDVAVAQDVQNQGRLVYRDDGSLIGMSSESVVYMFDLYGVDSHIDHGDIDELRTYLDDGRDIILAVDSSEVWGWQEQGLDVSDYPNSGTADRSDHFLVITEINDQTGMVTLNDPGLGQAYGFPEGTGHGYQISIDQLEDAWADSGHEMVVTDDIATPAAGAMSGEPAPIGVAGDLAPGAAGVHPGLVLLPAEVGRRLVEKLQQEGRIGA